MMRHRLLGMVMLTSLSWMLGGIAHGADDLFTRRALTACDTREEWAAKGVSFDATLTQVEQGVVDGGKSGRWEYGGRAELMTTLDSQKMGLWPGGFLNFEVEGNWEKAVSGNTGGLMPVNANQLFPLPTGDNFNVPQLSLMQFLSHYFGITAGKFDTSTGDANDFAHGKGDTQFMNLAFNI